MELVEREPQLEWLRSALRQALVQGSVVAVAGEAGAGKSALVRSATSDQAWTRVVRGLCDPLDTPRPLGPVRDVLAELGEAEEVEAGSLARLGELLLGAARSEATTVVVEDAQWIDEASADVLRFVVRRIESVPLVLVLTYRDAEIGPRHTLRPLLGDLARLEAATTLRLPSLSVDAVRTLLRGTTLDPVSVLGLTGGNPFFVTEVARHPADALPASVRDAVLASTASVEPADLEVLQLIAAAPDAVDDRLLPVLGIDLPRLRRLEATGLLTRSRRGLGYRHELARLAVEAAVPAGVAGTLHARVLAALEEVGRADPAVLAHHAHAAGDRRRTARYADLAAVEAARTGSHREAVSFLRLAVDHVDEPAERAELLHRLGYEQYMVSRLPEAVEAVSEAARLWERVGDRNGLAAAHNRRALVEYYSARRRVAEHHVALAVQEGGAPTYGAARGLQMLLAFRCNDLQGSAAAGAAASTVADRRDDEELRLRVQIIANAAALLGGDDSARAELLELVDAAAARGFDETASTGWSQTASLDVEQRRFRAAEELLRTSLPFTIERDIPICNQWQTGVRSRLHLHRGRWAAAVEDARAVLDEDGAPIASLWPHLVEGLVALRRGEPPGPEDHLELAWALARDIGEPLAQLAVSAALAERAWVLGGWDPRLEDARSLLASATELPGTGWARGDLAVWLSRLDRPAGDVGAAGPHHLQLGGDPDAAAHRWRELGAPFEAALAALGSPDPVVASAAVGALEDLGATASADRARTVLRDRGVDRLPARRRPSRGANPSGLTNRQLDVARLVARGLTNAELAGELFISTRTADHHVSAVLAKLGLQTRREVVRRAAELGLG